MSAPNQLFRRWQHSFEEDHDGVQVYRPADHELPRARGRAGLEFHPDGTAVQYAIGRGDAPAPYPGNWQMTAPNRLQFEMPAQGRSMTLEVVKVEQDVLEVRQW